MPPASFRALCQLAALAGWLLPGVGRAADGAAPVPLAKQAEWRLVNFAPDAGVQRRGIADLAFEADGTAWFAVSDGVYRYDGYTWKRFTTADGLPSNFVRSVTVTAAGKVWVGTDRGAGTFDGRRFERHGADSQLAGPNVRRIVETRDGALWFCCDRWPDATAAGGLTRLKDGQFRTWRTADGLPSEHVLGLFEQSNGRLFVFTANGPAVREGDRFFPFREPGFPAGDHTWSMVEAADGTLFAQGSEGILRGRDGQWTECARGKDPKILGLCLGADGVPVIVDKDVSEERIVFARWENARFAPASVGLFGHGLEAGDLKAAPDGAIWSVGQGTILRWDGQPGAWEAWPELPPPVLEDRDGRKWFADAQGTKVLENGTVTAVAGMAAPLREDPAGGVWGAGRDGVARWQLGRVETYPASETGLMALERVLTDAAGALWFAGADPAGKSVLARHDAGGWTRHGPAELGDRRLTSLTADPTHGVWVMLFDPQTLEFEIRRGEGVTLRPVPIAATRPRTGWPGLQAGAGKLYLFGQNGLWESPLGSSLSFTPVAPAAGSAFAASVGQGDTVAFLESEHSGGGAGVLVGRNGQWLQHPLRFGQGMSLDPAGWLLLADGPDLALWQTKEWPAPTYVSPPLDAGLTAVLRCADGEYWLGTSRGTLQLRSQLAPPETEVTGPDSFSEGSAVRAMARGIGRFVPKSRPQRHSFNWRIDDAAWSGFGDWPEQGVALGHLPAGVHVLEVQARDGLGNADATPAKLVFQVRALPLQDRRWFRPAAVSLGGAFAALSLALLVARKRLTRHAQELEGQVARRTSELREDIRIREQVEAELRNREVRARTQAKAIARVVIDEATADPAAEPRWSRLAEEAALAAGVARAGIWEINRAGTELRCLALYDSGSGTHAQGAVLSARDYPRYFAALRANSLVAATDAIADPRTSEFAEGYLRPLGIAAMLDAAIQVGGQLAGVLCFEHVGAPRAWQADEETFANAAAAVAAQLLANRRRQLAEATLRDERLRLGSIIDAALVGTWEWNVQSGATVFNERWAEIVGYTLAELEPIDIRTWVRLTHPDDLKQSHELLQRHFSGELPYYECDCRMRHRDGHWVWVHDRGRVITTTPEGKPLLMFGTHTDVSERRRMEEERERLQGQLLQSQKMESVGRLAGGVAHDFNNMLQTILGNANLAVLELPSGHPARECLDEIQDSANRSAELTKQLLAFARKQTAAPQVLRLNDTVGRALNLLRRLLGETIELAWQPGNDLWLVEIDPTQFDQVLTNLCVNARDAMAGHGRITIRSGNVTVEPAQAAAHPEFAPGDYVVLSVSDTGCGMSPEILAHIFEPFFTTKDQGKGTGLGLAIVFGLVKQNRGHVFVESEVGQGATFRIYLPRCTGPAPEPEIPPVRAELSGRETILLVEDEEQVLRLGRKVLTQQGYRVLAASSPAMALELAEQHDGPIDLLLTDVVMPGMNGRQLSERLRASRPGLRCLFMSGYTADVLAPHGVLEAGVELLHKPFSIQSLSEKVREILG
jgi:PAS domain S-box-containing protein